MHITLLPFKIKERGIRMYSYQKEEIYELLKICEHGLNHPTDKTPQDNDFQFDIKKSNTEGSESYSLTVRNNKDVLFTADFTKYDERHFIENVHQPFMWDGDAQERHAQKEWQYFLSEKEAWTDCPIVVAVQTQDLKITDPNTIEKLFDSIGIQYLLENISQYTVESSIDYGLASSEPIEPETPEDKAVSSIIHKVNTIKNRF